DADGAIAFAERAAELCRGRDFTALWAIPASILGPAYTLTGRAADAIPLLEQAAAIASVLAAPVLTFLGEACLLAGRIDEARHAAITLLRRLDMTRWLASAERERALLTR